MITWTEFLAEMRLELKDTGSTPKWSDGLLLIYTKDAVRDYSRWFPQRFDRVQLTLADGKYALPGNFIEEIHVECPLNTFLERRRERSGVRFPQLSKPFFYFIQSGSLYLSSPSDEDVYLTYNGLHDVPASSTDTTFIFSVPDIDIELIRIYVKASAIEFMRTRAAALDRFKVSGTRDDNPLLPETTDLMKEYEKKIADRVPGGVVMLYRLGRRK